jgi:hypothetical protein
MTYDTFHKDADRIYHVRPDDVAYARRITSPWFLAKFLKEDFPEIEDACKADIRHKVPIVIDGNTQNVTTALVDSAFLKMFDVRLIEGNMDFLTWGSHKIAITEDESRLLFGDKSPIGETLNLYGGNTIICAVVSNANKHSNIYFQYLEANINDSPYAMMGSETFIKLRKNTDIKNFARKLHDYKVEFVNSQFEDFRILPLTSLRYKDPNVETQIKFQYLLL